MHIVQWVFNGECNDIVDTNIDITEFLGDCKPVTLKFVSGHGSAISSA